jgi:hypothetical protein
VNSHDMIDFDELESQLEEHFWTEQIKKYAAEFERERYTSGITAVRMGKKDIPMTGDQEDRWRRGQG